MSSIERKSSLLGTMVKGGAALGAPAFLGTMMRRGLDGVVQRMSGMSWEQWLRVSECMGETVSHPLGEHSQGLVDFLLNLPTDAMFHPLVVPFLRLITDVSEGDLAGIMSNEVVLGLAGLSLVAALWGVLDGYGKANRVGRLAATNHGTRFFERFE